MDSGREFKKKYEYEKSLYNVASSNKPRQDAKVINDFHKHDNIRKTNYVRLK